MAKPRVHVGSNCTEHDTGRCESLGAITITVYKLKVVRSLEFI